MLNGVAYLNWTPSFKCGVVKCGSKNGHQKYMCPKAIALYAQNMSIVLDSTINIMGGGGGREEGLIWPLDEHKNLHPDK